MSVALEDDLNDTEQLLAELKAIEVWDAAYWRNHDPDVHETIAFVTRKKRRSQIIRQMLAVRRSPLREQDFPDCPITDS